MGFAYWLGRAIGQLLRKRGTPALAENNGPSFDWTAITYPATNFVLSFDPALIPARCDRTYKARSHTTAGLVYEVNLKKITCTCPDFIGQRSYFEPGNVRRVCKHILEKLKQTKLLQLIPEPAQTVLFFGNRDISFTKATVDGREFLFCYRPNGAWVRACSVSDGAWEIVSYNLGRRDWSHEGQPKDAALFVKAIESTFPRRVVDAS